MVKEKIQLTKWENIFIVISHLSVIVLIMSIAIRVIILIYMMTKNTSNISFIISLLWQSIFWVVIALMIIGSGLLIIQDLQNKYHN